MFVFFIAIPRQTKISLFNQRVCHQEAETCRDSLLQGNVFKKFTTLVVNLKSLTKCFYFQVLESITILEQRRLQGHLDMTVSFVFSVISDTVYSQCCLNGHLSKTESWLKWTSKVGPCLSLLVYISRLSILYDISLRRIHIPGHKSFWRCSSN